MKSWGIEPPHRLFSREESASQLIYRLAELGDPYAVAILEKGKLHETIFRTHGEAAHCERARETYRLAVTRAEEAQAAEDARESAEQWDAWRRLAGYPATRSIAEESRLSFSVVSEVLRGLVNPVDEPEIVDAVFNVLRTRARRGKASLDPSCVTDE